MLGASTSKGLILLDLLLALKLSGANVLCAACGGAPPPCPCCGGSFGPGACGECTCPEEGMSSGSGAMMALPVRSPKHDNFTPACCLLLLLPLLLLCRVCRECWRCCN